MLVPKNAKAIVAQNEDGSGRDMILLKVRRGKNPMLHYVDCKLFNKYEKVTTGDQGRYDYHVFYLSDDTQDSLPIYFTPLY